MRPRWYWERNAGESWSDSFWFREASALHVSFFKDILTSAKEDVSASLSMCLMVGSHV